jgi:uncharacterized membrane protein
MSRVIAAGIQPIAVGLVVLVYAVIAHWFSTASNLPALWLPLAIAPLGLALACNARWRIGAVLIAIAGIALVVNPSLRALFSAHLAWIYFLQDSALNITLATLFGLTLLPGRVPLCSQLQALLQPEPSMQTLRYTRAVTQAWTGFFVLIIAVSTCLFCYAERATWSLFANLLYWPLLLTMFALEYGARLLILQPDQRPGFRATISAFSRFSAQRGEVSR